MENRVVVKTFLELVLRTRSEYFLILRGFRSKRGSTLHTCTDAGKSAVQYFSCKRKNTP